MNSTDIVTSATADLPQTQPPGDGGPAVRIKELSERDRRSVLMHFLALDDAARTLRFGCTQSDELITRYVQKINFSRDALFGVYDDEMRLVGVAHLAFIPCGALGGADKSTAKGRVAEFGVSVLKQARGHGIGSRLFERAAMHCRNEDVDTLYVHCLTANSIMMHIATKAGMQVHRDHGEADAYLKLPPADPASVLREAVEEQVASLDYAVKSGTHAVGQWLRHLPGLKGA